VKEVFDFRFLSNYYAWQRQENRWTGSRSIPMAACV
jgi:hypothetical protein